MSLKGVMGLNGLGIDGIMKDLAEVKEEMAILVDRISEKEKENARLSDRLSNMDTNISIVLDDLDERVIKLYETVKNIEALLRRRDALPIVPGEYK